MNVAHDLVVMPIDKLKKYIADVYNDSYAFNGFTPGLKTITPQNVNILKRGFFRVSTGISPEDNLFFMGFFRYKIFTIGDNTVSDGHTDLAFFRLDQTEDENVLCNLQTLDYQPNDYKTFTNNTVDFGIFNYAYSVYNLSGVQTPSTPDVSVYGVCFELID